jgi:hypothetical protein
MLFFDFLTEGPKSKEERTNSHKLQHASFTSTTDGWVPSSMPRPAMDTTSLVVRLNILLWWGVTFENGLILTTVLFIYSQKWSQTCVKKMHTVGIVRMIGVEGWKSGPVFFVSYVIEGRAWYVACNIIFSFFMEKFFIYCSTIIIGQEEAFWLDLLVVHFFSSSSQYHNKIHIHNSPEGSANKRQDQGI